LLESEGDREKAGKGERKEGGGTREGKGGEGRREGGMGRAEEGWMWVGSRGNEERGVGRVSKVMKDHECRLRKNVGRGGGGGFVCEWVIVGFFKVLRLESRGVWVGVWLVRVGVRGSGGVGVSGGEVGIGWMLLE